MVMMHKDPGGDRDTKGCMDTPGFWIKEIFCFLLQYISAKYSRGECPYILRIIDAKINQINETK